MMPDGIRLGQTWADNDPREIKAGTRQRLRVIGYCRPPFCEEAKAHLRNEETGVETWVKFSRMRPNSRGYRLVQDVA